MVEVLEVRKMRIRSRTARRFDLFDRRFDRVITPVLLRVGFSETQPYVFTRTDPLGEDVVYFDIEGKSFIVFVSFRPEYMDEIDVLYDYLPKQPVIGAASYLTPKCTTHRPKEFPCRKARDRDHSFDLVVQGLNAHALDWLASLRDRVRYADAVPPTMMMYVGRANEAAGRLARARQAYEEQLHREMACWDIVTFSQFVQSEAARPFVYLCLKLRRQIGPCERVMEAIKFRPTVAALANAE
jgi:hypothetical protein